jgi:hypothetical protein
MTRSSRRPTGVQHETTPPTRNAEPAPAETPATEAARLGLGWRIALLVWLAGFLGLMLFEVVGLVWRLLHR